MNKRLLILSGLAIIAVVANHASHDGFIAMFWWTDRYWPVSVPNYDQMGSLAYYGLVAAQKLALFSVPAFLFISGVFVAYASRGSQSHLTWSMVRKRVENIVPPYLIWLSVYFLGLFILGNKFSLQQLALGIFTIDYSPFFFVPLLIAYYLISPFLAPLAKDRWQLLLLVGLIILGGAISYTYINLYMSMTGREVSTNAWYKFVLPHGQFFEFFFYYVFGLVAGFHLPKFKDRLVRSRYVILVIVILAAILAVVEAEWVFQTAEITKWRSVTLTIPTAIYAITFILCFLAFDQAPIPLSKQLYQLGVATLGVYLVHKSILLFLPKIVYHVLPGVLEFQFLYQPLLIGVAIGVPLTFMALTRRTPLRKYFRTLFG